MSTKKKEIDTQYYENAYREYIKLYTTKLSDYEVETSHAKSPKQLLRCFDSYLAMSLFFQGLFISKNGYVIDTGNFEDVNCVMMDRIQERVKKHPLLWKLFFMIA